jgi:HlyD family secretion protein
MTAITDNASLTSSQLDTYKANATTARTNVNTALTSINTVLQNIAAQKLVVKQSEADLDLTLAGNTPQSIHSEEAKVKQAEARAQGIAAQIQETILRAPFGGIVTKKDAKVGEIASPNTPVISLISEGKLEIEANIPEVDVGKVATGNSTTITLDAFPGEVFTGRVGYIDPAETIVDGVTNFKTKIAFDQVDPRLKSGLTANVTIKTLEKNNVLVIPQYVVTENEAGSSVQKQSGDQVVTTAIVTGLRGEDGLVEVLSGLSEGDVIQSSRTPTP